MAYQRQGERGVHIRGECGTSGIGGALYVKGRLAAGLLSWTLHENTLGFTLLPGTTDPLWQYGAISHVVLLYRGTFWIYRVQAGFLADGRVTIVWPSWLRMPTAPGPRLPML
jgi:hypothetical protein